MARWRPQLAAPGKPGLECVRNSPELLCFCEDTHSQPLNPKNSHDRISPGCRCGAVQVIFRSLYGVDLRLIAVIEGVQAVQARERSPEQRVSPGFVKVGVHHVRPFAPATIDPSVV